MKKKIDQRKRLLEEFERIPMDPEWRKLLYRGIEKASQAQAKKSADTLEKLRKRLPRTLEKIRKALESARVDDPTKQK